MRMKRMIAWMICAVMLLAMIPAGILTAGAGGTEGDWTVWCDPDKYEDAGYYDAIKPDPGYQYTDEGFTTICPDYTNYTPQFTVQTKEAQPLKEGFYMQIRIDDYPYGGEDGWADHWISFNLSDREGVSPGRIDKENNWLSLIRGPGAGSAAAAQSFLTTMTTEKKVGSFALQAAPNIEVPMDDEGREIYTFEVVYNRDCYELKINGVVVSNDAISTALNTWVESGEYYVGVTMHAGVPDASASMTILKYGTNESTAVTPTGTDSLEPEENWYVVADIADSTTVPVNQPAILWSPETYEMRDGENISFAVQDDNTWHATASGEWAQWNFRAKSAWSYAAEYFPVFGILFRNISEVEIHLNGETGDPMKGASMEQGLSCYICDEGLYDGQTYGTDAEYVFIPFGLYNLNGRIYCMRLTMNFAGRNGEFDICFAGVFRSTEEAYTYTEEYLAERGILTESVSEKDSVAEPEPGWPDSQYPETQAPAPIDPETKAPESENSQPGNSETETLNDVEFIMTTLGCSGSVSGGAVLVLLIGAVLLKKKED